MKYILGVTRLVPNDRGGYYRLQEPGDIFEIQLDEGQRLGDLWLDAFGVPGDIVRLPLDALENEGHDFTRHSAAAAAWQEHAAELARMHPDDLAELRRQIVDELGGAVISAALPAWAGEYLARCAGPGHLWRQYFPVWGDPPGGLWLKLEVLPGGALAMELERQDGRNQPFWRGTLRPQDYRPRRLAGDVAAAELADDGAARDQ